MNDGCSCIGSDFIMKFDEFVMNENEELFVNS